MRQISLWHPVQLKQSHHLLTSHVFLLSSVIRQLGVARLHRFAEILALDVAVYHRKDICSARLRYGRHIIEPNASLNSRQLLFGPAEVRCTGAWNEHMIDM